MATLLSAKNETNQDVDWWFIYKTPKETGSKDNKGFQYLYYDAASTALALSAYTLDKPEGALYQTLTQIFGGDKTYGYIVYNDEQTDSAANKGTKGHCKGVLAFHKKLNSAVLLLHSTPRFPANGEGTLPLKEADYGQTFLCITLDGYATINELAAQMLVQQDPQVLVEDSFLPDDITSDEPLYQLFHQTNIKESAESSVVKFNSKGGKKFQLLAKSKKWGLDFWLDLIAPTISVDFDVESWRRGAVTASEDDHSHDDVEDVMDISLAGLNLSAYEWSYTKDHSKWGAAQKKDVDKGLGAWVCIADINRMVSQEKRGGGGICFEEKNLWAALNSMESKVQEEK
jgi:deoxyribonuclease II